MTGFNSKRMIAIGRGTGKSTWQQMVQSMIPPDIRLLDSALVDGKMWYTVQLSMPAAEWLSKQPNSEWVEQSQVGWRRCFDVSGQMYSALNLKWS